MVVSLSGPPETPHRSLNTSRYSILMDWLVILVLPIIILVSDQQVIRYSALYFLKK